MAAPGILVVEDEQPLARILAYALGNDGYRVETAGDGIECMNRIATFSPDVVIMDIMMPKLDGVETIKLLRQNQLNRDLVIVALSARCSNADREAALAAGANVFMKKPFAIARLLESVEQLLASERSP
jgi:two-component system response regulator MprA